MNTQSRIQNTCYLIILFFSVGIYSCTKSPEITELENPDIYYDQNMLDTLWTVELFDENHLIVGAKLKLYNGFLYTSLDIHTERFQNYLAKIEPEKGIPIWEVSTNGITNISENFNQDKLVLKDWEDYVSYDLNNGSIIEYIDNGDISANPRANFVKENMYFSEESDDRLNVYLYKTDVNDLSSKKLVYTLKDEILPGGTKSIESVNSYIDKKTGHEMLVFQHRMVNLAGRVDFVFYDMTKGKVTKLFKDIEPNGNSSVAQILIEDGKAYFQGSNTVYCFDLKTQEMLWYQRYLGDRFDGFMFTQLEHASRENLIIAKGDAKTLYAFDPDTGEEVWVNREAGHNGVPVSYHEGYIYYIIAGELRVVRASNGETVAVKRTPLYSNDNFSDGSTVEIDGERKLMYITSGRYIYCAKLIKG